MYFYVLDIYGEKNKHRKTEVLKQDYWKDYAPPFIRPITQHFLIDMDFIFRPALPVDTTDSEANQDQDMQVRFTVHDLNSNTTVKIIIILKF